MDEKLKAIQERIRKRKDQERVIEIEEESRQVVVVTLSDQLYAFHGTSVMAIAFAEEITPIPGTPDHILGVVYFKGAVESVLDIKRVLDLGDTEAKKESRIIIAEAMGLRSGILVNTVEDVFDLPTSGILPPLTTMDQIKGEYVIGEADYKGRNMVILNLDRIFQRVLAEE